ncbi:hypothetical protein [uncultured Tateyamaria sp.]|uniref:hypothetical protein n=1 Tax=uncultured Tateyamaria sp. TaxID=455651 RepID=UPI00261B3E78|nr:hypothetical protein [uncultured Tateyamaria sp.]
MLARDALRLFRPSENATLSEIDGGGDLITGASNRFLEWEKPTYGYSHSVRVDDNIMTTAAGALLLGEKARSWNFPSRRALKVPTETISATILFLIAASSRWSLMKPEPDWVLSTTPNLSTR